MSHVTVLTVSKLRALATVTTPEEASRLNAGGGEVPPVPLFTLPEMMDSVTTSLMSSSLATTVYTAELGAVFSATAKERYGRAG
jgi:hypothetical protein